MPDNIDSLQIEISANAQKADKALDNLAKSLSKLSSTLGGLQTSKFYQLADGMQKFTSAMDGLNGAVKAQDFTRIATGLNKIAGINASGLRSAAVAMQGLSKSLNNISFISFDSQGIANMANAISLLGRKTITQAAANIPQLTASLQGLVNGMNSIGTIKFDVSGLAQLASSISKLGGKTAANAVPNIQKLAVALKNMMQILSTAPMVSQNLIQMTQALAQLAANGTRAGTATRSLASSFNIFSSSAKNARKHTFSLASAFGKFYATWFLLIRGIGLFKDAIDISSDLQEVQNVVDVTFGDMAYKVEDLASHSIEDFGMSELTAKKIASRFQAMGTAMGFTQERMSDMSVTLTELAADMASFYNVEQEDVAKSLQSIFTGETEPMRQYGIDLTNATVQQWALNNGIKANMSTMTNAEKTLLRYQYTLEASSAAAGDFARTSGSWANQLRILTQSFQALGAIVGEVLINAFKPFIRALNSVMQSVINFARTIANALGNIFGWTYEISGGGLTDDFEGAASGAGDIEDNLGGAADKAKKLKDYMLGIDELNVISPEEPDSGSGSGEGGAGGGGAGDAGKGEWIKGEGLLEKYKSEIDSLYELGQYIRDTIVNTLNSIDWKSVYAKAEAAGRGFAEFLNGLFSPDENDVYILGDAIGKFLAGSLNTAIHFLYGFADEFNWRDFGMTIAAGLNAFFSTFDFALLANTINLWAKGILETILTIIDNTDWEMIGSQIGTFLAELDFLEIGSDVGEAIWGAIDAGITVWGEMFNAAPIETSILTAVAALKFTKLGNILATKLYDAIIIAIKTFFTVTLPAKIVSIIPAINSAIGSILPAVSTALSYLSPGMIGELGIKLETLFEGSIFDPNTWDGLPGEIWRTVDNAVRTALEFIFDIIEGAAAEIGRLLSETFDWDKTLAILGEAGAHFSEALDGKEIGKNIVLGIGKGIVGALGFIVEPIGDLFVAIWDGICSLFGIHSPATAMEPIGENIILGIGEGFRNAFSSFLAILEEWWTTSITPWFTLERWTELFNNILLGFQNIWTIIVEWWNGTAIVTWWNENVMPWFTLERWIALLQPVLIGFQTKFQEIFNFVSNIWNRLNTFTNSIWTTIKNFLLNTFANVKAKVVEIWTYFWDFISTKWTQISENTSELWSKIKEFLLESFENIKENISEKWNYFLDFISGKWDSIKEKTDKIWGNIKDFLFETIGNIKSEIDEKIESIRTFWDETFGKMWDKIRTVFDDIKEKIQNVIDWALEKIQSLKDAISNLIDNLNPFNGGGGGGISFSIPGFASGGFPERGELFMARESGTTEMVGSFGSRTAVANNDQIVAGIATGVRAAVAEVVIPYLDDLVTSNREIAAKDVSVNIGDRAIAQANVRGQKSLGAQLRTV